jgi:hypothetical protein
MALRIASASAKNLSPKLSRFAPEENFTHATSDLNAILSMLLPGIQTVRVTFSPP